MSYEWLERQTPDAVLEALGPFVTDERRARIDAVLAQRLWGLTVVLENLHDPHNGAAALRSTEGFGLSELHVVEQAEPFRYSSKVTQGCEKWVSVTRHEDFAAAAAALHARGFALWAALPDALGAWNAVEGSETAPSHDGSAGVRRFVTIEEVDVTRPAALVFGNEHAGLTGAAQAACDGAFRIPMAGFTQSFNLSVSVAVSLYDCARRRRAHVGGGDLGASELARLRARWYAQSMDARAAQLIVERHVSR